MGKWTLEDISGSSTDLNPGETFGTNWKLKMKLKYTANLLGKWTESPQLNWHERFTTLWHHQGTYWTFEHNMFDLKPTSPTFHAWSMRYIDAYNFVTGNYHQGYKGSVTMHDVNGRVINNTAMGKKTGLTDPQKAEATRSYLKSNGGILEVEIHDVPAIGIKTKGKHVERLLLFECGLAGGRHISAMQYLDVNTDNPQDTWKREFKISSFSRMDQPHHGLRLIPTPLDVATAKPGLNPGMYM